MTLVMAGVARLVGGWVDTHGPRLPLTVGPVIAGLAFAGLALAVPRGAYWAGVLPAMALLGLGMGIAVPPLAAAVMGAAPDDKSGAASGVNNAVSRVSQLLAVAGLGVLGASAYRAGIPDGFAEALSGIGFGEAGEGLGAEADAARRAAIGAGFRMIALASGALAWLAAVIGWLTIKEPSG